jgi:hypothetical protein
VAGRDRVVWLVGPRGLPDVFFVWLGVGLLGVKILYGCCWTFCGSVVGSRNFCGSVVGSRFGKTGQQSLRQYRKKKK